MQLTRVWVLGSLFAALGLAQQIAPADGVGAVLAQPQTAVTLQVQVTDSSGNPLAAQSVLFIAPDHGPSGEFTPGAGDTQSRLTTDNNGLAAVQFYTNNLLGPFMVSAWAEGTGAVTQLAITNSLSAAPPLDPATALAAVQNQLAPAAGAIVYGPFLLDPGTVLTESGGPTPYSITLQSQAVFFWIDDNPLASYDHPVRWVVLDATNPTPTVTPTPAAWAPYVTPAGGTPGYGLVDPYTLLSSTAVLPVAPPERKAAPRGDNSNTNACAVLVYGSGSEAFANSEADIRDVMSNTLNIPDGNILEDTTSGFLGTSHQASTPSRLHNLFVQAKAKGCKKLYFYFAGHGYTGGFCLAKDNNSTSTGDYDDLNYTDLANEIANTGITDVSIVIQACHSGSAIPVLQGHGFNGEIATATDTNGLAYYNPVIGFRNTFWTQSLVIAWKVFGANYSVTTIAQSTLSTEQKLNDFTAGYILPGNPRTASIDAAGGKAATPAQVLIEDLNDSSQNPTSFTVTIPSGFPPGGGDVQMYINDVTVAMDPNAMPGGQEFDLHNTRITLQPGTTQATFMVKGLKEGDTPYTITFTDQDHKTYTATGTIVVGTGYSVAPSPVGVHAGGTATVHVTRSPELAKQPGAVTVTVKAADANSAAVATPKTTQVTFQQGQTSADVTIQGLKPGMATMSVGDGKATKTFQVNVDNLSLDHSSLQMKIGDTQTVLLERMGFTVPGSQIPSVAVTAQGSAAIITPTTFPLAYSTMTFPLTVTATSQGTATFTFTDTVEGYILTLPVSVGTTAPPPTPTGCPASGTLNLGIQLTKNPFASAQFVMMPATATIPFTMSNGQLFLNGTIPQLPPGSGTIDPTSCSSTIKTVAQMPIAGFTGVHVQYLVDFQAPSFNSVNMQIQVGTDNTLNNEPQPVTYTATGTVSK